MTWGGGGGPIRARHDLGRRRGPIRARHDLGRRDQLELGKELGKRRGDQSITNTPLLKINSR